MSNLPEELEAMPFLLQWVRRWIGFPVKFNGFCLNLDRLLSTTFDPVLRLEILFMLISDKITEMRDIFEEVLNLARHVAAE